MNEILSQIPTWNTEELWQSFSEAYLIDQAITFEDFNMIKSGKEIMFDIRTYNSRVIGTKEKPPEMTKEEYANDLVKKAEAVIHRTDLTSQNIIRAGMRISCKESLEKKPNQFALKTAYKISKSDVFDEIDFRDAFMRSFLYNYYEDEVATTSMKILEKRRENKQ